MKLSAKIIALMSLINLFIVTVDSVVTINRELKLFYTNAEAENIHLSSIIKDFIVEFGKSVNYSELIRIIDNVNKIEKEKVITIRNYENKINLGFNHLDTVKIDNNEVVTKIDKDKKVISSFFRVTPDMSQSYIVEISQSILDYTFYISHILKRIIFLSITLLVLSIILIFFVGNIYIKRPLKLLKDKNVQISKGDFDVKRVLKSKDELYELESSINEMALLVKSEIDKKINTLEQLRHAERLATIGKIASGIAHEVGTPVNVIRGRAQIIKDENLSIGEMKEYSSIIIEQSDIISAIIRQLLNFARIKENECSITQINDMIKLVVNLFSPTARKLNIEICLDLFDGLPFVNVDHQKIQQAFSNIIMNGFDSMRNGGKMKISTSISFLNNTDKYVMIKITDTGTGISENEVDKIFDAFYTTKPPNKGTGLGLSIVKNIIDEHDGYIKVETKLNEGTSFLIYLPVYGE